MKYIILLWCVILISCNTTKKIANKYNRDDRVVLGTITKSIDSTTNSTAQFMDTTYSEGVTIEVIDVNYTAYKNDSTGEVYSVITKSKTTKYSKSIDKGKSTSKDSLYINTTRNDNVSTIDKSSRKTTETAKDIKKSNVIVKLFILLGVLLVGGYIVVKKYFPGIFVKIIKSLKSIIK